MPFAGMYSQGHDGYLLSYSSTGVQDSFQVNTSALCSRFNGVCPEIPQNNSNQIESPTAASLTRSGRYKTELCRQFSESGSCRYGDRCQFAHGVMELRDVERHPKYKTNLCRTFHSTGFCPYGARCHFIHSETSASNPTVESGLKAVRQSTAKQNSRPLDAIGISAHCGISMNDNVEVERLICGFEALMDCSVKDSSLRLIQENVATVLPSQRQFPCLSQNFLSSIEGWGPSAFYLMGSTSVTPSLSCSSSDSATPSPTPALSDADIWKSLANVIGVGV